MDPLLVPLAQAAFNCYALDGVPTFQNELRTCHVFESRVGGRPCFAFEGTIDIQEWIVDLCAFEVPVFNHLRLGPVHLGFWLDIEPVLDDIENRLQELGWPAYYLTGHSKGGGEAILAHGALKARNHGPLATRVFEPPCVGSAVLARYLVGDNIMWTQTFNEEGDDIITLLPGGPTWAQVGVRQRLIVPDTYSIAEKHRMEGVMTGLDNLKLQG